jgi:2-desacetyl-2-hydroxyethyl bacteriochlorophyllide A dehydrogenase
MPIPGEGEVLIRTLRSLISTGTELTVYRGTFPTSSAWSRHAKYPYLPGYSNVGVVVDVGPGVDRQWIGKRVGTYGYHAAYVVEQCTVARPIESDQISNDAATFFTIAEIVMNGVRRSQLRWGESAGVYGLGLLGQITVRFAQVAGAFPVLAIDVNAHRLKLLGDHPAVVPILAGRDDLMEIATLRTRNRMVDVVFEVTGNPALIAHQFEVLRPQGRFVVLSSPKDKTSFDFHDHCNAPSYTIIGAHNASHPTHATLDNPWTCNRDGELFFDLVANGLLEVESLISHRVPFGEATEWYPRLDVPGCDTMGVILTWPE